MNNYITTLLIVYGITIPFWWGVGDYLRKNNKKIFWLFFALVVITFSLNLFIALTIRNT
jgi:heme/copper-type cytochrome/quinol oxidase subunit 4